MRALIEFWTELIQVHPDIEKLSSTGQRARRQLNKAVVHYERALEVNPENVEMLRTYGAFCLDIIADFHHAQRLFCKADFLIRNKQKVRIDSSYGDFLRVLNRKLDLFDEENAVISVSIDSESMGIVSNVNAAFLNMMGYSSRGDILGKSINTFIPNPIKVRLCPFV